MTVKDSGVNSSMDTKTQTETSFSSNRGAFAVPEHRHEAATIREALSVLNDSNSTGGGVQLRNVYKTFGGKAKALDGFNLDIKPGEMVVLLGRSGCGKTTALRALAGLEDIDSGQILVGGHDVTSVPVNKRDMAMVFQAYSLFPHMTALQNVEFGLEIRGISKKERRSKAGEMLELVGLSDQSNKYTSQMSGGQQQRVALARSLAISPRVLLLDEPLSALDAKVRVSLREEIRRIQLETGTTTLFVTHDQEEALAVADRIGVMNDGRIEQIDAPRNLYQRPKTEFVATFIGLTNRLPGILQANASEALVLGQRVPLVPGSVPGSDGDSVTVLARPETLGVSLMQEVESVGQHQGKGDDSSAGALATVVAIHFLGAIVRVEARMQGNESGRRRPDDVGQDQTITIQVPSGDLPRGLARGSIVSIVPKAIPALAVA
ncbi:MAG: ATP-binding cassette domain-containing protein [Bifidobacterium sp.]